MSPKYQFYRNHFFSEFLQKMGSAKLKNYIVSEKMRYYLMKNQKNKQENE